METPSQTFTGDRLPQPTEVMDVLADVAGHERSQWSDRHPRRCWRAVGVVARGSHE